MLKKITFTAGLVAFLSAGIHCDTRTASPKPANAAPPSSVQGPQPPLAAAAADSTPSFELDKRGKRDHLDFNLALKPVSDPKLKLSHFSSRKLLVYYFSSKCPHCQHAIPTVQKLADELAGKGVSAILVGIKNNTEDDIRGFIRDYKVHLPVFHDDQRAFGEKYGTGSIPLVLYVNEKGEYIRFKEFDDKVTPDQLKKASTVKVAAK